MTDDEVGTLLKEQNKVQLATINRDGTPHLVTMFYGLVDDKIAFWTYRSRMMDLEDDDAIAPIVEQTAAKRYAYIVEPTGVASWDHRKLT
jgi:nitroimidazol reductase NimA-like FMN-containing flavoprotein (pyridoxamine 5'-phosphate oxidase superfamily)